MHERSALWPSVGSLIFFFLAPGTVAGIVPWLLSAWRLDPPLLGWPGFRLVGALFIVAGIVVLLDSFARFALQGRGTPSPVLPTQRLVVWGWYRFVRNPMYVAVVLAILGQALLLDNRTLMGYAALVGLGFHAFVVLYEEPSLRRRYGAQYAAYCSAVRRWWPRLSPWTGWRANSRTGAKGEP